MPRKKPRKTEPERVNGPCACQQGHLQGFARSTRKTAGRDYFTEPANGTAKHMSACPHSMLYSTTRQSYGPPKRRKRPPRHIDRHIT